SRAVVHVCQVCIGDPGLKRFVTANAVSHACDFCGAGIAAPMGAVVEHINGALTGQFAEAMPVAWRPGEKASWYPGTTWSTDELLWDLVGLDLRDQPKLFSALVNALGSERRWSTVDPAVLPEHEQLRL